MGKSNRGLKRGQMIDPGAAARRARIPPPPLDPQTAAILAMVQAINGNELARAGLALEALERFTVDLRVWLIARWHEDCGKSWADIGASLGMSRSGVAMAHRRALAKQALLAQSDESQPG